MQGRYAAKLFAYPLLILAVTAYLPLPSSHLRLRALSRGAGHVLRRHGSARRDINYAFRKDASFHRGLGWHPKYSNAILSLRSQTADVKEESLLSPQSLEAVPVLKRVAVAAKDAVTLSTGEGTESSGKGRYEWGTWCDDSLFAVLKETINDVVLKGSPELWEEALWPAVGGEQAAASLVIARGTDWEMKLHLFMAKGPKPENEAAPFSDTYPTGSLVFLKPLLGNTNLRKVRKIGSRMVPLGDIMPLKGPASDGSVFGGAKVSDYQLLLGGAIHELAGTSGPSVVLEIGLLPPMGLPPRHNFSLPTLPHPVSPTLATAFVSAAKQEAEAEESRRHAACGSAEEESVAAEAARIKVGGAATQEMGNLLTSKVGGLGPQLEQIVRRVLVSRADTSAARALGISHVKGILLSGPPGCGKTLLARQLSQALGAREPMIVNGPEILDKFVGEAEKKIRALFAPSEAEWKAAGDASALHVIVLDEFDAIARKRGSLSGDTTGVRDSVVNQLLAKMDGVDTGDNFLVVGLTNRPELLDEALLRPGRLEVHLKVELPDLLGRRDILRIHTRAMSKNGALAADARALLEDVTEGLPAMTEHYSGAELSGVVRSAASYALARAAAQAQQAQQQRAGHERPLAAKAPLAPAGGGTAEVSSADFLKALGEVTPVSGRRQSNLLRRFSTHGIVPASRAHALLQQELKRFVRATSVGAPPRVESVLLTAAGRGAGVTALAAWAAAEALKSGAADYGRILTMVDLAGAIDEAARCSALVEAFAEAKQGGRAVVVLDDIDRMVAGGGGGASAAVLGTLRALLREPLLADTTAVSRVASPMLLVIGTTSSGRAACTSLEGVFDAVRVAPLLSALPEAQAALVGSASLRLSQEEAAACAEVAVGAGALGVKTLLMLASRAVAEVAWQRSERSVEGSRGGDGGLEVSSPQDAMKQLVQEWRMQEDVAQNSCSVF